MVGYDARFVTDASNNARLLDQSQPIREVWRQAWPTVLTMTSYTVMQFVDALMVAQLGPLELAAQGNGGIWSFVPIAFVFGVLSIVNTFVAQNLGAGRNRAVAMYGWGGLWVGFLSWILLLLPWAALMGPLFAIMGHDEDLRTLETRYAQILLLGAIFVVSAKAMSHWFFGFQKPGVITISAFVGNIVNILANYVLVFGEAGIPAIGLPGIPGTPQLGVLGAALGTVIGTAVEFLIPLVFYLGPKLNAEFATRSAWRMGLGKPIGEILKVGFPPGVQISSEMICWALFMTVLVGAFGEDDMAAGWAVMRYLHFSFMPAVGFSVATTSLVGKWVGAGRPELAVSRTRISLTLAVLYMTLCGVIFIVFRYQLIGLFVSASVSEEEARQIIRIGGMMMLCGAFFQAMDAVGIVYTGALRGAGDTYWPGIVQVMLVWVVMIGGGLLLMHLAPGLESLGPWIAAMVYLLILGVAMAIRFEGGSWRRIDLLGSGEAGPSQGSNPNPQDRPESASESPSNDWEAS